MKTVRFSKVVGRSGSPETHLLLTDPAKDRALQSAVKAHRVMTVFQTTFGTKADRGEVGLHSGPGRQFLIFPKSLKSFEGRAVVGIKYDLVASPELSKAKRAPAPQPPKKPKAKPLPNSKTKPEAPPEPKSESKAKPAKDSRRKTKKALERNVIAFPPPSPKESDDQDEDVAELKKQIRRAMTLLEGGKAVAAYNLLKRSIDD